MTKTERRIGYMEGYRLCRRRRCEWMVSVIVALIWVLRGDKILADK